MKTNGFLLCLLVVQAYASFFDNFQGVMASVTNNFGTLLGDVITDVRKTIDCSILAVEQLLSISGMFEESSDYKKFCKGESEQDTPPPPDVSNVDNELSQLAEELTASDDIEKDEENIRKEFDSDFGTTYSGVNETLCGIHDDGDPHARLENAKTILKNETDRLAEVSALLRRELENISKDMRNKFDELKASEKEVSFDSVWHDMKLLHEVEQNNKDSEDAKIISGILDEALDILHLNDKNSTDFSNDDKMIEIIQDLEEPSTTNETHLYDNVVEEIEQWHNETANSININATIDDYPDIVSELEKNETLIDSGLIPKYITGALSTYPSPENNGSITQEVYPTSYDTIEIIKTLEPTLSETTLDSLNEFKMSDYAQDFFGNNISDKNAINSVKNEINTIIDNDKKTKSLMSTLFDDPLLNGTDVFENPHLLGYFS